MIRRPAAILVLLTGLNLLNYLDRLVLSAVLPKVQEELGISNFVGGLLATVFLLGYFLTAPIFGLLGDRYSRKGLITIGILVWSVATLASGLSVGMWSLLAARALVGVGEASYATLAPTIIDDITEPERKGRALAIFYLATPIGGALGYLVGGFVESHWGWRHAFYVAGGPGIVLALVMLLVKEPERKKNEKPNVLRDLRTLAQMPFYRRGVLGYCAYTAAIGAFSFWAPKFLYARYGMKLGTANFVFGLITVVAGALGTLVGGAWADAKQRGLDVKPKRPEDSLYRDEQPAVTEARFAERDREGLRALLRVCAIGSIAGAPLAVACFLAPSSTMFFALVFVAIFFLFFSTSPVNAVVLRGVPNELRASAMALCILAIHLLGDFWSPALVGLLADHAPIQLAMQTLPLMIAASAFLWWPRRFVSVDAAQMPK